MYADDTTISTTLQTIKAIYPTQSVSTSLNNELVKISDWLSINKLSINVKKSKYLLHKMNNKVLNPLQLNMDGKPIENIKEFNFLGLTINENLKWNNHIDNIAIKCSRINGLLNKLKNMLPIHINILLYNTLLLPHINYCILAWGNTSDRIEKRQKRAVRLITVSKYNAHTSLNILKVKDIFKLQVYKLYYKYKHNRLPTYLQTLPISANNIIHGHNPRHNTDLHIQRTRHTFAKYCIRHIIPELIINTPYQIISKLTTHSEHGFANSIKNYYIQNYQEQCIIHNCYICRRQ